MSAEESGSADCKAANGALKDGDPRYPWLSCMEKLLFAASSLRNMTLEVSWYPDYKRLSSSHLPSHFLLVVQHQ